MAKKKEFKSGDKVQVFLQLSDFDKVDDNCIANYSNPNDCPLARAIKRRFGTDEVTVMCFDFGAKINDKHWENINEWDGCIASIVGTNLHAGDKTRYYVTLTKG
jgi:hypothetical protein